ncbi:MAG TPA: LuxR C-terminal-related transcriptional regulator [Dehalococcoidia bacterium]|jgi:DNA-binding CsgD family transcriptional regulator
MVSARYTSRLLEREQELTLLQQAWRETRAGRGSLWLLCAEAGGGKTRLAAELSRESGARTLWGAAEPVSPPEPYLALKRALPGFAPATSRERSIADLLVQLDLAAERGALLCVLDDLHFADEGTIAVLVRLALACRERPWLILATLRPGEGSAALQTAVTELVAQGQARRLDLAPLSPAGVAALVAAVHRRQDPEIDAGQIYRDSGGNPWFVEALARGNSAIAAARDRLLLRLDRLEHAIPGACTVLAALAPASHPLPHPVAADLCGGDGRELRRVLLGLRDAGVLVEESLGWGFRHELLRRSLLDGMIAPDRADAHRALAEALERREAGAPQLAMHYAAAGDPRAAPWALRAAREASAVDAHAEALEQLHRALACDLAVEERRTTLRFAAAEAFRMGRFAEAQELNEAGIALPDGEPEAVSLLHQRAANAARLQGRLRAAGDHMDAAEQLLADRPASFQKANVAVARALQYTVQVRPDRAIAAIERALALARELRDPARALRIESEARAYLVLTLLDRGDPSAFQIFERLLEAPGRGHNYAADMVIARINTYSASVFSLFHHEAERLREELLDGIRRQELGWLPWADPHRVLELVQRGRYGDARALAHTLMPPQPGSVERSTLLSASVLCEVRAGSLERARALLREADPIDAYRHQALLALAALDLALVEPDAAAAELAQEAYTEAERRQYARLAGVAALVQALAGLAPPPRPGWLAAAAPLGLFWDWASGIAAADGAALLTVSARLAAMDCPYEAALALRDAGDLAAAYKALGGLGATNARRQVAMLLRSREQRIPRRSRAAVEEDGLTPTEREVCRLVAAGANNRAIAAQLSVSVRTVESHLARIYPKTGQRGRVALAVWWRERSGDRG